MTSAEVQAEIEQLAAAMLDSLIEVSPERKRRAAEMMALEASVAEMAELSAAIAARGGPVTLVSKRSGPHLALSTAALVHVLFGRGRAPLTWCPHRRNVEGDPVVISATLRYAGCAPCVFARTTAAAAQLADDNTCDVCGGDGDAVTPRLLTFGAALVNVFSGPCCDGLFMYPTPGEITATFRKVGRNEPCPCGSASKFKRCHGRRIAA